ncbi:hypothetical protein LV716_05245 [Flagellimonas sp. HMM57]|uniref:hypothetical protein n=1 Tax=unclassified Flagellimonas TaxID=2644544 RepID=UPI0013D6359A|nr:MULTISPECIES: hypothetical protein [unclassified Flagellimonas]UII77177.1 hypothetical protein LV716_05245 [Flagellimonas sp. HMM57]
MKPRQHLVASVVLLACILVFGFTHKVGSGNKEMILWSETQLKWDDFEPVRYVEDGYDASINSSIFCPDLITEKNSKVYAYMNPNESKRLKNEELTGQLLIHEQYHFNITEYCARLLRKDIIQKGLGGLSFETIKSLKAKYSKKLEDLHDLYDSISDHNVDVKMQRYWELKIDDWLRQTAYYKNKDIYDYYDFSKNRTNFYRHIYFTFDHKVLTSYPVGEREIKYGKTYELIFNKNNEKIIRFYKNGELFNGGYFGTAITKIIKRDNNHFEVQYLNPDESYNKNLKFCVKSSSIDKDGNWLFEYLDDEGNRINNGLVFMTQWEYDSDSNSYFSSYFGKGGKRIANNNGIYHEKRVLDEKGRTILFEGFDQYGKPKNDNDLIAKYELEFNDDNLKSYYRLYNESGDFAYHLNDFHLTYVYDERGNITRVTSLDADGKNTYDQNGASIYEYTYDLYDNETSIKRFNEHHKPIIANDDIFHIVKEYDSLERLTYEATYYPEYVLRFTESKLAATKYLYEGDSIVVEQNIDGYGNIFAGNDKIAITRKKLNSKKYILSETYFDKNGNFAKTSDGVAKYTFEYDRYGNKIETKAYDSIGLLKEFDSDVAIIRWEYDNNGNKSKTTYFTKDNELANTGNNTTYNFYKYNSKNQLSERTYYDIKMKPSEIEGAFKKQFYYNQSGLDSLVIEYDIHSKLKKGVAITKYIYNKYGNKVREEYFDSNWKRVKNENGVSVIVYVYNERQLITQYHYLDEQNRLTNNQYGVAIEKWAMDDLVHTLTYEYFDKNLKPVIGEYGYHKIDYEWHDIGEAKKSTTYDVNLDLIEDEYGTAIYKYKFAPSGLIGTIERYNKNGDLADNTEKVAVTHYKSELNGLYYLDKQLNAIGEVVNDSLSN